MNKKSECIKSASINYKGNNIIKTKELEEISFAVISDAKSSFKIRAMRKEVEEQKKEEYVVLSADHVKEFKNILYEKKDTLINELNKYITKNNPNSTASSFTDTDSIYYVNVENNLFSNKIILIHEYKKGEIKDPWTVFHAGCIGSFSL